MNLRRSKGSFATETCHVSGFVISGAQSHTQPIAVAVTGMLHSDASGIMRNNFRLPVILSAIMRIGSNDLLGKSLGSSFLYAIAFPEP
jgi:hypothetical protein